jgi:molybdopterin molybdotransferase
MIDVEEADKIIFQNIKEFPAVQISLQESFGMVLQEDLIADRDLPPFHRVTMDGIAINFDSWDKGNRVFPFKGVQKAGSPPLTLKDSRSCVEVMTGAILPEGCDCVVPIEQVERDHIQARIKDDVELARMNNVHVKGSDHKSGSVLILKGNRLLSPLVAVAASVGKAEVMVTKMPKVAVVGTGDELVGLHQKMEPTQIRQSNSYALQSALSLHGYDQVTRFHLKDDKKEMIGRLGEILKKFDVLILSGGVSMGEFDYVPEALKSIGVEALFHKVKQRPGKPLWFGKNKDGKPVFALPGNPVSTQICFYRYVLPYLNRAINAKADPKEYIALDEDFSVTTALTYFLPVKVESERGKPLLALPVNPSGSGDYVALAKSDGFIELPAETFQFTKGTPARLFRWKL